MAKTIQPWDEYSTGTSRERTLNEATALLMRVDEVISKHIVDCDVLSISVRVADPQREWFRREAPMAIVKLKRRDSNDELTLRVL